MTITPEEARQILKCFHYVDKTVADLGQRLRAHAESDLAPLPELGKDRVWRGWLGGLTIRAASEAAAMRLLERSGNYCARKRFREMFEETKQREHLAAARSPGVFEKRNGEWVKLEGKT